MRDRLGGEDRRALSLRAYALHVEAMVCAWSEDQVRARCGGDGALLEAVLEYRRASESDGDAWLARKVKKSFELAFGGRHLLGRRAGGYLIEGLLGSGGTGVVYSARDLMRDRRVALKVLVDPFLGEGATSRFGSECRALEALEGHPLIAKIFEAGVFEDGDRPLLYCAMELIEGGRSLTEHADIAKLDVDQRIALLADIADAIAFAHRRGIIHRDLKPANILVDAFGIPRVIDFGIAHFTIGSEEQRLSMKRELLGTVDYMSPEQFRCEESAIAATTDVYALGVVLYELVAQRKPFELDGSLAEAAVIVEHQSPRPWPWWLGRGRAGLQAITQKALAKDPRARYATADELARDLRALSRDRSRRGETSAQRSFDV